MASYLDNNATTALDADVLQAMLPYMGQVTGNPASVHRYGRLQKDAIEQARESVARLCGAHADQVVFTSGGTESNNLLLNGFYRGVRKLTAVKKKIAEGQPRIAISAVEHMSLIEPAMQLTDVDIISVDANGCVQLSDIEQSMNAQTSLVSVMTANNETGVIQPLASLIEYVVSNNCFFHTDASQAAGKIPLDFNASGVHAMTVSAHKIYGPTGAGALLIDKSLPLSKIQFGGSQENNLRAGTENVPAIVGFGKAAEIALAELEIRRTQSRQLRDALEAGLNRLSAVTIFAEQAERLPNTVQFAVSGFSGETLLMQLDRKVIAVSSGSACTSSKTDISHVLKAMNVPQAMADSAIRVSFGKDNTMTDVDALLEALQVIIEDNQNSSVMMAACI